jgi:peptidoglycan/xylan/chitin deacetylase (PgdA/CDA1 family)
MAPPSAICFRWDLEAVISVRYADPSGHGKSRFRLIPRSHALLAAFFLIGINSFTNSCRPAVPEKQIYVVFRLDDFSALSSADFELRIIEAFRKAKASMTIGVIPFDHTASDADPSSQDVVPLTPMKAATLKAAIKDGTVDVALHGYSHQAINAEHTAEFSGLGYDMQLERLAKGKEYLEAMIGVPVTTFVPPWNRYDLNTIRALEELGFSTISAALPGPAIKKSSLNFLPSTCNLKDLRDAVRAARSSSAAQPLIVVLFHEYDFREVDEKQGNITYPEFADLLEWLRSGGDLRLLSISEATKMIHNLDAKRFLKNNAIHAVRDLLPSSVRKRQENLYADSAMGLWMFIGVFYLGMAFLAGLIFFLLGWFIFPKSSCLTRLGPYGVAILSVVIIIYAFHDLSVNMKGMMASAGAVGATMGIWICARSIKKRAMGSDVN